MNIKRIIQCLLLIWMLSCRDRYESPVVSPQIGYLVVEGSINIGSGGTSIKLSRINNLRQITPDYVKGATVQVESDDNQLYPLSETPNGVYASNILTLPTNRKYRLRIKAGNKEYLSSFSEPKETPAIDSISWRQEAEGLQITVNTHDPDNDTRYYRWEYLQTWEFHAPYMPQLKYKTIPLAIGFNYTVEFLDPVKKELDTTKFRCWQSNASTSILLGSTVRLSNDEISMPMIFIARRSVALSVKYTVLIRQYALSREEYEFLDIMRKNTELTGSIFDPQPSQLKGNIACITDPSEPVIGYVGVSSLQQKRIFINSRELTNWGFSSNCSVEEVENKTDSVFKAMSKGLFPTTVASSSSSNEIATFNVSKIECIDCTLTGTNKKPDFWQ